MEIDLNFQNLIGIDKHKQRVRFFYLIVIQPILIYKFFVILNLFILNAIDRKT